MGAKAREGSDTGPELQQSWKHTAWGNANGSLNSGNHCLAATGDSGEPRGFSIQKQMASCARDSWRKSTHGWRGRPQRWQEPQASHQDS